MVKAYALLYRSAAVKVFSAIDIVTIKGAEKGENVGNVVLASKTFDLGADFLVFLFKKEGFLVVGGDVFCQGTIDGGGQAAETLAPRQTTTAKVAEKFLLAGWWGQSSAELDGIFTWQVDEG